MFLFRDTTDPYNCNWVTNVTVTNSKKNMSMRRNMITALKGNTAFK